MTKLIPLDAAIAALDSHAHGKTTLGGQTYRSITLEVAVEAIRAIPTIDPAAIREAALRDALAAVLLATWKHNGDDSYSAGLEDGARRQNEADYEAILALIGEKK